MTAKQHFNNFMIVVCGSHRARERYREGERGRWYEYGVFRGRDSIKTEGRQQKVFIPD